LGVFTTDNATTNDKAIEILAAMLKPAAEDPGSLRVRCLGHIINLAAKAFLFGRNAESFEVETSNLREITHLEALLVLWRKQGPLGKLHNTLAFIRKTPQRREAFQKNCKAVESEDTKGTFNIYLHCSLGTGSGNSVLVFDISSLACEIASPVVTILLVENYTKFGCI